MADFVKDRTSLPTDKLDAQPPPTDPAKARYALSASEWVVVMQAMYDLRNVIPKSGTFLADGVSLFFDVSFGHAYTDANYVITLTTSLTADSTGGGPAVWYGNKTSAGFTIFLSSPFDGSIDWSTHVPLS